MRRLLARRPGRQPAAQLALDDIVAGGFDRLIDPRGEHVKVLGSARA